MKDNSRSIEFTEIDLFEEEPGISIPPRESIPLLSDQPLTSIPIYSREKYFVQEAQERAHEEGGPVAFIPFMSYWPTYQDMTANQQKWYFYWRSEVRRGHYPDTDLSYIFVYLYELIHGVGWSDPKSGYELIVNIASAYGSRYPQLMGYSKEWLADFLVVHSLDISLTEMVQRLGGSISRELMDIELLRLFQEPSPVIPLSMLLSLSDYDLRRSKFYQGLGRNDLEEYVPRIVTLVDTYLQRTSQQKLIDRFPPGKEKAVERYLFRSAVYDHTLYGTTITITTVPMSANIPLRKYITQVIRFTENILREIRGYKGRLRGIILEAEVESLIERYLKKEFSPQRSTGPKVTIDHTKLENLLIDTEHVQSMLTIPVEPSEEQEEVTIEAESPFETAVAVEEKTSTALEPMETEPEQEEIIWDTSNLDEEWSQFAKSLNSCQLEAICALRSSSPAAELVRVAEAYGTMPELIMDEINNCAMETIGDLVIDGDQIAEEYQDYFENLKG